MKYYFEPATFLKSPYGTNLGHIGQLAQLALKYMEPREEGPMSREMFEPAPGKANVRVLYPTNTMTEFEIETHSKLALLLANYFPSVPSRTFKILKANSLHLQRIKANNNVQTLCLVLQGNYDFSFVNNNTTSKPSDDPCVVNAMTGTAFIMDGDCWHSAVRVDGDKPLVMLQIDMLLSSETARHNTIGRIEHQSNLRSNKHFTPEQLIYDPNKPKPYLPPIQVAAEYSS